MLRTFFRRAVLAGVLGVAGLGFAVVGTQGCGDSEECVGGVIKDGKCEGKCEPSKCLENNTCVDNRCVLQCATFADCLEGQTCSPKTGDDGSTVNVCEYSSKAEGLGSPCPYGDECGGTSTCPDGTPCGDGVENATCTGAQCQPLHCLTAGLGDGNAYCTNFDCTTDADCADGMGCGVARLDQKICGTTKGTENPCVDPADFHADGATYAEGPLGLLRNVCRKRADCAKCEVDADCSLVAGQSCVTIGTENVCAKTCATKNDCEDDHACIDGNRGDDVKYCVPKLLQCSGTGQFCEPCSSDLDCAGGGPNMACIGTTGDQTACFDVTYPDTCTVDEDCPVSPGGKHGACFNAAFGLTPSDPRYDRCFLPYTSSSNKFKCW